MLQLDRDPRRAFVLNSVADAVVSGEGKARLLDKLLQENSPAVSTFLDDASTNLLQVWIIYVTVM